METIKDPIVIYETDNLISSQAIRHIVRELQVNGNKVLHIHTAWQLIIGKIMVYEYTSTCTPSSSLCFFDTLDDYNEACDDMDWLSGAPLNLTFFMQNEVNEG